LKTTELWRVWLNQMRHRGDPPSKSKYYSMTDSVQVP